MIVTIGVIARPHGVRGDVVVDVRTDSPAERFIEGAVIPTDPPHRGPLTILRAREHSGRLLVQFEEIADRAAAEAARGIRLLAEIADNAETGNTDEYFDHQLVGLSVELPDGRRIGEVARVVHGPGQDLLAVRQDAGEEALIPFVSQIVVGVDVTARRIKVDPPIGLLEVGDAT
jgi:16S rRNA processing protein RimM